MLCTVDFSFPAVQAARHLRGHMQECILSHIFSCDFGGVNILARHRMFEFIEAVGVGHPSPGPRVNFDGDLGESTG